MLAVASRLSLLLALLPPIAAAQDRGAEVVRPSRPVQIDPVRHRTDVLAVKFVEGHRVRLDAKGEVHSATLDLDAVRGLFANRRVEPMFTRPVADLEREQKDLSAKSGMRLADLANYYLVQTYGAGDTAALCDDLLGEPAIETAYPESGPGGIVPLSVPAMPSRPDIPPTTPSFESNQTYFAAAPNGHGHLVTRSIDGAQGVASQIVAHIEGAWILGHEDAEELVAANVIGTTNFGSYNSATWIDHGTACFGILNATRNAYGTIGFAPLARGRVCSLANGAPNMISLATAAAQAGDVFTSSFAYVVSSLHAPVDWPQASFDAVKTATAKGICYTYSAGNSGADLATVDAGRYGASAPDSGGFIIGGTYSTQAARSPGSNWGAKVVANGWYDGVATLGYGTLFRDTANSLQNYTGTFGGTSAAAPQVAGVIASLQGAAMRQNGKPLAPAQVRALLLAHGTPVTGNIGLRPDLAKLMLAAGTHDGLLVRREPVIGNPLDLEVSAAPARIYVTIAAAGRASLAIGLNRNLLVDLSTMFVLAAGPVGATGKVTIGVPVPNVAALRGLSIFAQTLDMKSDTTDQHLTNSIEAWVR